MPLASLYINSLATLWTRGIQVFILCLSHQSACKSQTTAHEVLVLSVHTRPRIKPTGLRVPRPGALQHHPQHIWNELGIHQSTLIILGKVIQVLGLQLSYVD
ncbi:hypothetical protein F5148DRAFT_639020 [Russula earlei]|uniref:Uncharacterized protein n=1 Tax=Russula earlei TaxID=71964 RepID=A0ACC0UEU0_9AGAM|nr:hypothetical protein F5148DRAFT_639020 [Russula earlei]